MDTWIVVKDMESSGERNRGIYILKSRGMAHSDQVREFVLSSEGINLVDVYVGPGGVLTGTERLTREAKGQQAEREREEEIECGKRRFEARKLAVEAQVAAMMTELRNQEIELEKLIEEEAAGKERRKQKRAVMARQRQAD